MELKSFRLCQAARIQAARLGPPDGGAQDAEFPLEQVMIFWQPGEATRNALTWAPLIEYVTIIIVVVVVLPALPGLGQEELQLPGERRDKEASGSFNSVASELPRRPEEVAWLRRGPRDESARRN